MSFKTTLNNMIHQNINSDVISQMQSNIFSNIFQFLLKLIYPIRNIFLLPAGFELQTILLLVSDADTLTN